MFTVSYHSCFPCEFFFFPRRCCCTPLKGPRHSSRGPIRRSDILLKRHHVILPTPSLALNPLVRCSSVDAQHSLLLQQSSAAARVSTVTWCAARGSSRQYHWTVREGARAAYPALPSTTYQHIEGNFAFFWTR